jgi:tetratricopeptide (TPR) repeat protein
MLLDVPLEDQFVVVPATGDEDADRVQRSNALRDLAQSRRRGYRTFDPLPPTIDPDADMFDLAQQALSDVADLSLMQEVLEDTHQDLLSADRAAGWRPRPFEKHFAQDIEIILASRGAPERLEKRRADLDGECRMLRRHAERRDPEDAAEAYQFLVTKLSELAGALHQLQRYEEAARRYEEVIGIVRKLTSQEPAIGGYNRACALARAGQRDKAIAQLARALDPEISSGTEDLTREWVMEDGDLLVLHSDPQFEAIMKRRFGP